jgi:hypothetical protein
MYGFEKCSSRPLDRFTADANYHDWRLIVKDNAAGPIDEFSINIIEKDPDYFLRPI